MHHQVTPIYILSGFLGSGKTTLLSRMLSYWKERGLKPAVVMNEIGEVNIEGMIIGQDVPTAEMLSGCICCSIRADLTSELALLIQKEQPDVIIIEATGAANPMEILDAVAEASLYIPIDVKNLITVVDSAHLLHLHEEQKGKTYRLMQEQIRCASLLILNKIDRVSEDQQTKAANIVRGWNSLADIIPAVRCDVNPELLSAEASVMPEALGSEAQHSEHPHGNSVSGEEKHIHHHTHDHVMSCTYYLKKPIDSVAFEELISELPREIYRAKGIISFSDTASRFLFQYAYRESDYMKINPQGELSDVVVFIGEHFSKSWVEDRLFKLEQGE
ncbi:CobW family GTP-binding protein [Paenibacillus dakarensis]|uniref:CobW family GTP-binding protein n=1 Tax=Paenibacillus dakarensis TaxID=1527293 RepID=UPI0006D5A04B|nr:CobW family GTP-binding protein [Paenibacillus dakarensis]